MTDNETNNSNSNGNTIDYIPCNDCGTMVPEANMMMHQAHACGGRARPTVATSSVAAEVPRTNNDESQQVVIDISESPAKKPASSATTMTTSKRSIVPHDLGLRRRRQRTSEIDDDDSSINEMTEHDMNNSNNSNEDVIDLSNEPEVATVVDDETWSCPQCTLTNPLTKYRCEACQYSNTALRPPDATRSERLVDDFGLNGFMDDPTEQQPPSSTMLQSVGGGALLGSLLGGAASYMRGRSVADGMMEGAVSGAVGGAIADTVRSPPSAARSSATRGHPPYPTFGTQQSRRAPRASLQVRQHRDNSGRLVTSVVSSSGGGRMQRVERPGGEDPLMSLMMAMGGDGGGLQQQQHQHGNTIDGMGYEQLLQAFGDGTENMGADEQVIQSLPIRKLQDIKKELPEGDARECCICLDEFEVGETRKTLPCLHGFHSHCIDKALRNRGCCPICNSSLS